MGDGRRSVEVCDSVNNCSLPASHVRTVFICCLSSPGSKGAARIRVTLQIRERRIGKTVRYQMIFRKCEHVC